MQLRLYSYRIAIGISCFLLMANPIRAQQVSLDGTTSTSITSADGSNFTIKDGNRVGDNLFHSFKEFSVPTGGSAFFDNGLDVKNIIGRVTGGKISNIDGLLGANGGANLFLINPSGIIFGANASLNIGGSFISSTANSLKFADGTEFSATAPSPPLLTVSVPVGLQYGKAAEIQVQSNLAVQPKQTLALVGGNVTIAGGNLTAPSGRIELAAVADEGEVAVDNQLRLSFPQGIQTGDISIADAAKVSANGSGGGDIQLTGKRIKIERSRIEANTEGSQPGGNFNVNAGESVELIGAEPGERFDTGLFAETFGTGDAAKLSITTGKLILRGDARVSTATWNAGMGGDLSVNATESVEIFGVDPPNDKNLGRQFTGLLSDANSSGAAGNLKIQTTRLLVRDGGIISATTYGAGNSGKIAILANQSVELIGESPSALIASGVFNPVQTTGTGTGADITINAGSLSVLNGATIFSGTAGGAGNGGNLTINARESVEIMGSATSEEYSSRLNTVVGPESQGNAGDLTINTKRLIVRYGGQISAHTEGGGNGGKLTVNAAESVEVVGVTPSDIQSSGLYTSVASTSTGNGGDLIVNTGRLIVSDGAQLLAGTLGVGNGGDLTVNAKSIEITGVSPIAMFPSGLLSGSEDSYVQQGLTTGNAGNVTVNTDSLIVRDGAKVQAASIGNAGQAGNLTVKAKDLVELSGTPPENALGGRTGLVSNTTGGFSNSGNVMVDTDKLIVRDGARIAVNNEGTGKGGEMKINARSIVLDNPKTADNTGTLTAATASGDGGNINLNGLNSLLMRRDSKISASAGDYGNGGNIQINAALVSALDNSEIIANAFKGNGGDIQISSQALFKSPHSQISASSEYGVNGLVGIRSPQIDPTKGLVTLSQEIVDVTGLVAQGCNRARNHASSSEFLITGRGGLPTNPTSAIAPETVLADLGTVQSVTHDSATASTFLTNSPPTQIVEAQGWLLTKNGRVFLTANAPVLTPHSTGFNAATCSSR